jgi:hypothetical protein
MESVLTRYQRQHSQTPEGQLPVGSLTYSQELVPFHGIIAGELVKISREGNIIGSSPCFFAVDRFGNNAWVPQTEVIIADPVMLPIDRTRLLGATANAGTDEAGGPRAIR